MTRVAGIRDLQRLRRGRRNEFERVAPNIDVGDRLLDFRHVASDAFVASGASFVVRMLFGRWRVRTVRRARAVTIQA